MGEFMAEVDAWTRKSEQRMTAVFRQAAQTVAETVKTTRDRGGHMRVKTGYLRASLMASTSQMPGINPMGQPAATAADNSYAEDGNVTLVIAGADPGETIYLGFTANYSRPREYQDGFVRLTAQQWPRIVEESAKLIKSRVDARAP